MSAAAAIIILNSRSNHGYNYDSQRSTIRDVTRYSPRYLGGPKQPHRTETLYPEVKITSEQLARFIDKKRVFDERMNRDRELT